MALIMSSGGAKLSETVLWTRSDTGDFSAQNITLSDNYTNYKYLKIKYLADQSNSSGTAMSAIFDVDELPVTGTTGGWTSVGISGDSDLVNGGPYARQMYVVDNTTLHFEGGLWTSTSAHSAANYAVVPIQVIGIK